MSNTTLCASVTLIASCLATSLSADYWSVGDFSAHSPNPAYTFFEWHPNVPKPPLVIDWM